MTKLKHLNLHNITTDINTVLKNSENVNETLNATDIALLNQHLYIIIYILSTILVLLLVGLFACYSYGLLNNFLITNIMELRMQDYDVIYDIVQKLIQSNFTEISLCELKFISLILLKLGIKGTGSE